MDELTKYSITELECLESLINMKNGKIQYNFIYDNTIIPDECWMYIYRDILYIIFIKELDYETIIFTNVNMISKRYVEYTIENKTKLKGIVNKIKKIINIEDYIFKINIGDIYSTNWNKLINMIEYNLYEYKNKYIDEIKKILSLYFIIDNINL